jgi:TP901 family phage tail tape measure protein
MSDLDVAVKARFVNQMGSGARSAERDLKGVRDVAQRLGSADFGARMRDQLRKASEGAAALHDKLRATGDILIQLKAGYEILKRTLAAPALTEANYKDQVISIAQKANIAKEGIAGLSDEIKGMAERLKTSPLSVAQGIDVLMGSGINFDPSKQLIAPIVKVAKAYQVETDSVSKAVFAMVNNLKIAPDQVELALGKIAQAASDGRYEISNFAEGLPQLAATMQGLQQTGLSGASRLAAALETVSGSVGDPSQATTNVNQMLQKALSPDVVKNFKDAGIDITKRIAATKAKGGDIFETLFAATMKATGGDTSKAINFFGDEQARGGIVALMQNIELYRQMRDRYEAINSPDKLNSDLALRKEGPGNTYRTFGERWQAFQTAIGQGVNTYLKPAADVLSRLLDVFTGLAEAIPAATGALTIFAATAGAFAGMASIGAFLKRFGGLAAGAAAPASASAIEGAAAGATAGGVWKWLGKGVGLGGKLLRAGSMAGWAYTGYQALSALGSGLLNNLSSPDATGNPAAGREKQRYDAQRRAELQAQIDGLKAKVAEIVKAGGQNSERGRGQIGYYWEQIGKIEKMMEEIGSTEVKPQIDPSSIDAAIGKVSALTGALRGLGSPSFMGNAAPASARAGGRSGGTGNTSNTYNVAGYNPGVVARRIQREQDRETRLARAGALHDLWSLA